MTRLRALAALLLALTLIWGSVADAVARNRMAGAMDQVICGGAGSEVIRLDASGTPIPQGHGCGHCLAATAIAVLVRPPAVPPPIPNRAAPWVAAAVPWAPVPLIRGALARAPPPLV
jgi:hypothetical protein